MTGCTTPRCTEPSVGMVNGRWWQKCPAHALEQAERHATAARRELDDLRAKVAIPGQDQLFEVDR